MLNNPIIDGTECSYSPPVIVVIDDDPEHLHLLERALKSQDAGDLVRYPRLVQTFEDPAEALANLPAEGPVVVLCDYHMPGGDGLSWLPDIIRLGLGPVIMMSAQGDEHIAAQAFRLGAADYLIKGEIFEHPRLLHLAIRDAARRHRLESRNHELSRELKLANTSLEKKNSMLREVTESAHRLVDDVAHEFRTPLTVIKEFASILDEGHGGEVTDRQSEYLGLIDSATRDLAQMVDDFLDTSKLRVEALRVDRRPHDPKIILSRLVPLASARARAKNIRIVEASQDGLPEVFCDIEKVGRVVINLVVNAIKFSPVGSEVLLSARKDSGGGVKIGVTDHGPGIPEAEMHTLCDRFSQVNGTAEHSSKGFGLGLNIASELAHLNLGSIEMNSKFGEGSTFAFILPGCDLLQIVARYIDLFGADHNSIGMSALHVSAKGLESTAEDLRSFVINHSKPTDLVLPTTDGSSLIILGFSQRPTEWASKLNTAWSLEQTDQPSHAAVQPLGARWLGTWPIEDVDTEIPDELGRLLGVRNCA